jgi:DNA-binding response OmpR family regulator
VHFPVLLLVDDDPTIIRSLQVNLEADGFDVLPAYNAQEALRLLERKLPDLAVVDLLLPDMHGFELCRKIKNYLDLPIIMLTAVGAEDSVVNGLEFYAEDYVVKPFSYRELLARINRVLKRTQRVLPPQQVVVDQHLRLDFARHVALVGAQQVHLTPVETRLLAVLARNANQVVPTEKLLEEVWPDGEGDPSRLWVNIRRLRNKLETDPSRPQRLVTERRIGYKLRTVQ